MPDRCPRNHLYTPATEKWYTHSNGKVYRTCGTCHALRARLKYRHDEAHREREKARGLARYHAEDRRRETAAGQNQTEPSFAKASAGEPQHDRHAPA